MGRTAALICLLALGAGLALLPGRPAGAAPQVAHRSARPGDLDRFFGGEGKVITDFGHEDAIYGLAVQPDGKIIAAGDSYSSNGTYDSFALARYTTFGVLDGTIWLGGKITTDFDRPSSAARSVALQRDGKIVAVGFTGSSTTGTDIALARYDAHGSPDGTFGVEGKVVADLGGYWESANSVVIQPDGKIV